MSVSFANSNHSRLNVDPFLRLAYTGRHGSRVTVAALGVMVIAFGIGNAILALIPDQLLGHHGILVESLFYASKWITAAGFGWIGIGLAAKFILKRPLKTLLTSRPNFRFSLLLAGMSAAILLRLIAFAISVWQQHVDWQSLIDSGRYSLNASKLIFSATMLLLIPIQAGMEEAHFRGFLSQALGVRILNRIGLALLIAVMFSMVHGWTCLFISVLHIVRSLLVSALCFASGGLESSIGYHAGDNATSVILLALHTDVMSQVYPTEWSYWPLMAVTGLALAAVCARLNGPHSIRFSR
jgi:membrane protease YdiL (CAAX protease family)